MKRALVCVMTLSLGGASLFPWPGSGTGVAAQANSGAWFIIEGRIDEGSTYGSKGTQCLDTRIGMPSDTSMTHSVKGKGVCFGAPSNAYSDFGYVWTSPGSPLRPGSTVEMSLRATVTFDPFNPDTDRGNGTLSVLVAKQGLAGGAVPQLVGSVSLAGGRKGDPTIPSVREAQIEWTVPPGEKGQRLQVRIVSSAPQTQQTYDLWYEWRDTIPAPGPAPSPVPSPVPVSPGAAGDLVKQGTDLLNRGEYAQAVEVLTRAIAANPKEAEAYGQRGIARYRMRDFQGALADFSAGVKLNPSSARGWNARGAARIALNDYAGALEDLNRAIALDPTEATAFNNRGAAKMELGDIAGAISDYEQTLRLDPNMAIAKKNLAKLIGGPEVEVLSTDNAYGVSNGPTTETTFHLARPHLITSIRTYHWNDGRGTALGTIGLRDDTGRVFGPWPASGSAGQGGAANANWTCTPNVVLQAGNYTIIDSEPRTWSTNAQAGGRGIAVVKGRAR